jgi:hypothetical protein
VRVDTGNSRSKGWLLEMLRLIKMICRGKLKPCYMIHIENSAKIAANPKP